MKVLYVTAANLTKNTSANMSHNGYVQGLVENGAEVDIIMANDSWGERDEKLKKWDGVTYHEYNSISFADKLRKKYRSVEAKRTVVTSTGQNSVKKSDGGESKEISKNTFRSLLKSVFFWFFKQDALYPLNKTWLNNAQKFKSDTVFDLVVSNSSPAASHRLVAELVTKGRIKYNRWIQIWEDPWYHDLYGGHPDIVLQEEHTLLRAAQEVYYVSPLTLHYQKKYFADCADKMKFIPLPFLKFCEEVATTSDKISFGYFGDYYSHTRNLQPFYDALISCHAYGNIFGDSDICLPKTAMVNVSGRVTLDVLEKVQDETTVLVHLCNLKGGQIPGKIYHYSATKKPILFILDGTEEEMHLIKDFFSQYKRYYFCNNDKEDIMAAITDLRNHLDSYKGFVVQDFSPRQIVKQLLVTI